jgi:hypothetical protein
MRQVFGQEFQGDVPTKICVFRLVNHAYAATNKLLLLNMILSPRI